ncbi:hypothetical protein [Vampirovibrio sp.]|uniref:hypothetical protein n=1 Tax=Vampirovibrio sp. TaxID=2717857 RepID=UPI0035944085
MSKQEKIFLFCVGVFSLTLVLVSFFWRSNQYYSDAYAPVVEKSNAKRAIAEENRKNEGKTGRYTPKNSEQPLPSGFRERDIDKKEGDRFSTY